MAVRDVLNLVGRRLLDRYLIERPLARGGMSVIYLAEDERLRRVVCVKVFSELCHQPEAYRTIHDHFVKEAFALSQLQHPNTLRIYDFGYREPPFGPFHVTEWIDGPTLAAHLRTTGALPPAEALSILEPIVGALAEAHAHGIVHRDLKPANILLGRIGEDRIVKLADFGIAQSADSPQATPRSADADADDTDSALDGPVSLYSVGWAAPEQLSAGPVGPTADVYALGLVAAVVLSGERVFADEDGPVALGQRMEGDDHVRRRLAELRLAPALAAVILRACKADPALRFANVDAFLGALRTAVSAAPARAPSRVPPPECRTIDAGDVVEVQPPGLERARLRVTRIPLAGRTHLNVRGIGCFVARPGARPSRAIDFDRDGSFEIVAMDRSKLDTVACTLSPQVILDFGPGRSRIALRYSTGRRPS